MSNLPFPNPPAGYAPINSSAYTDTPSSTSDASGNVTFAFAQIPLGTRVVGTVSVPMAPSTSTFMVTTSPIASPTTTTLMTWLGATPVGPFTIDGPAQLSVTGKNLLPATVYQAAFIGKQGPVDQIEPQVPTGPPQFVRSGPEPDSVFTFFDGAVAEPPAERRAMNSPGAGHAWRVFNLLAMVDASGGFGTIELLVDHNWPNFAGGFSGRGLARLSVGTGIAVPSPLIPTPAGIVLPDDSGITYIIVDNSALTGVSLALTVVFSLDH